MSLFNETTTNVAQETYELLDTELEQALQELRKANEQKTITERAAEALKETNERLGQELERTQQELHEVKEQNARAAQTMVMLMETKERLQKELASAQQDFRKDKDGSGSDQTMDELKETNERLDKDLERALQELRTAKEQKKATEQAAEDLDNEARQMQEENDALKRQLSREKEKQGVAAANMKDLQERLDLAQAQLTELSQRTVELEQELRSRPEFAKSPSLLEDSSVPQLQAEVNDLTAKKNELESELKNTFEQLREAFSANEDLQRRCDEMQDDLEQVTDAVSHERNEAKHYKDRVTELEIRITELETPAMQSSAKSLFAEVYDSRKQLEIDVRRLFYEKLDLQQKLNNAMRTINLSNRAHQPPRELNGATLEAFKMSEQSISDYRQQVRSLQDKVTHLEEENSLLRAPATPNPKQRLALGIRDTLEREKKELVTRVRNLEAEIETQKKALLQQLERNASVPLLEAEVKRLTELAELVRYDQSPEERAKSTNAQTWMKKSEEKEAAKKAQEEAQHQALAEPDEVPFEVRIRQKYEARKKEQEESASTSTVTAKPAQRKPPVAVKVKQEPTAYVPNTKK